MSVKAADEQGIAIIVVVSYSHFGPGNLDLWRLDGWSENRKGEIYYYMEINTNQPQLPESMSEQPKPDTKDDLKSIPLPELEKKLGLLPDGLSQAEAHKRMDDLAGC